MTPPFSTSPWRPCGQPFDLRPLDRLDGRLSRLGRTLGAAAAIGALFAGAAIASALDWRNR